MLLKNNERDNKDSNSYVEVIVGQQIRDESTGS
jgi:hypothetical protein